MAIVPALARLEFERQFGDAPGFRRKPTGFGLEADVLRLIGMAEDAPVESVGKTRLMS